MREGHGNMELIVIPVSLLIVLACVLPAACTLPQGSGQKEPPTVTVREPASGASVLANSYLYISASASGGSPITRVELWVDGELAGTQESSVAGGISPFVVSFELLVPPGDHTLFVRAVNAAGLMENSAPVNISAVENAGSGPGATASPAAPIPTNTSASPATDSQEPVEISLMSQQESVAANTPIVLRLSWATDTPEQIADFLGSVELVVTLDGQPLRNTGEYWIQAEESGDLDEDGDADYRTQWLYPVGVLSPGTHAVESVMRLQRPVTDGGDSDGDGVADEYSGTFDFSVQIVVGQ